MADIELVIKIPEEMHEQIKNGYVPLGISKYLKNGTPLEKELENIRAEINKENGFIFPENPTNGDMIKVMFPNIDKNFSNVIELNLWWNAPYKRGETE